MSDEAYYFKEQELRDDGLALAEKISGLWAVDQDKKEMIFKRADIEEIFKMATALREKAGQ